MDRVFEHHRVVRDLTRTPPTTTVIHVTVVAPARPGAPRWAWAVAVVVSALSWWVLLSSLSRGQEPEPTLVHTLAHPSPRAVRERQQTIEARRDWLRHRHIVLAEAWARRAMDEAPPPAPMPMAPSMGGPPP